MLSKRYRDVSKIDKYSFDNSNKKGSLQAQVIILSLQMRKRAHSLISSSVGSITVEASMAIPIFLCMVCTLLTLGQFLIVDLEVQHAVSQTSIEMAKQQAALSAIDEILDDHGVSIDKVKGLIGTVSVYKTFFDIYQGGSVCKNCILGGSNGILVFSNSDDGEGEGGSLTVKASYELKVPYLSYFHIFVTKHASATQRIFSGYEEHQGEEGDSDSIVYVTTYGSVYHTSLTCSNISRKISGGDLKSLESSGKKPCAKCIKKGTSVSAVYVTSYGTHYHSSLDCSELKRTVRAVRKSDLENMRVCSKCGASHN